ncbi:MAG: SET domain-containing protein-lysine N-methyltransferase, partial [Planctomycetaceae bacterium]|nr:SET domain-containing protein-lysine N-methyltransferase [Planctomycetaceae bacterium]
SELIEVRKTRLRGLGVFARADIPEGTVIERVPLLAVTWDQIAESELQHYVFAWNKRHTVIALGYGSLSKHSYTPNACYQDASPRTKLFIALRDIAAGEEILVNYNADPADLSDVGFAVHE